MPERRLRADIAGILSRGVMILAFSLLPAACDTQYGSPGFEQPAYNRPGGPRQLVDVSASHAHILNAMRAQHGLGGLGVDPALVRIAHGHADDMLRNGFFDHVSADGRTIVDRTKQSGYPYCYIAENLAMGQNSFEEVVRQWMTSPSHRSNVLHRRMDDFGLVRGPGNLWVLILGRPGC